MLIIINDQHPSRHIMWSIIIIDGQKRRTRTLFEGRQLISVNPAEGNDFLLDDPQHNPRKLAN